MEGFFTREQLKKVASVHIDKTETDCLRCGLYAKCDSPKMKYHGEGLLKCLLLAEAPGAQEDKYNTQLIGPTGDFLKKKLLIKGFHLKRDFYRINAVNCRPFNPKDKTNRTPSPKEIECCRPSVMKTIEELQPKFIWLMGQIAVQSILGEDFDSTAIGQWRGTLIPDQELRTWLMPLYHPSYPNRDTKNANLQAFYDHDLARALNHMQQHMNKDFPIYEDGQSEVDIVYDYNQILSLLESINNDENLVVVDYETTGLKPYIPGHRIATVSLSYKDRAIAFPYEYGSFFAQQQRLRIKRGLRRIWKNANIRKVAHNAKFEHIWTKKILDCEPVNWYWCTMQGAHIQDNRQKWSALKFQTYINFGQKTWSGDVDGYLKGFPFNKIDQAPLDKLLLYNGLDVHWTKQLLEKQELFYEKNPKLKKAFDLFNEGSIVLGDVQSNGVPVDEEYCYAERKRYQRRIDVIERSIYTSNEAQLFKERTGKDFGIKDKDFSDNDLRILFYDILGYTSEKTTEKGEVKSVDEETLTNLDDPIANLILKRRKFRKIEGTYLAQFIRETNNGIMHPFFDLIVPVSYRGSSSAPNFQNVPKRDEQAKKATRRAIIPSPGNQILESDFSGIEVAINACYNQDPTLIANVTDPEMDMHRDSAGDIWLIPTDEISKKLRFYAKNQWVFPQFYGSWYEQCAKNLWRTANREKLETNSGKRVIDLMKMRNIFTLEQFMDHCKMVEKKFWGERFQVYAQWKNTIQRIYRQQGYTETFLGFRFQTYMGKNECTNYQSQGTAFHILLWTLINVQKEIKRKALKSKMMGQIHDSMVVDAVPNEVTKLIKMINYYGTKMTRKAFKWISVPLKIDHELTEVDCSWYTKKEVK